jgi:hypothetical protein
MKKQGNTILIPKGKVAVEETEMDRLIQEREIAKKALLNIEAKIKVHKEFLKKELTKN